MVVRVHRVRTGFCTDDFDEVDSRVRRGPPGVRVFLCELPGCPARRRTRSHRGEHQREGVSRRCHQRGAQARASGLPPVRPDRGPLDIVGVADGPPVLQQNAIRHY